jgi:hypothetical protein
MRRVADAYPDRLMIGEAYLPVDQLMAYYGADLTGFHLPFNFHLISTDWKPKAVGSLIEAYEAALPVGGWRIGCSATTTDRESRAGLDARKPGSPPCCCLP